MLGVEKIDYKVPDSRPRAVQKVWLEIPAHDVCHRVRGRRHAAIPAIYGRLPRLLDDVPLPGMHRLCQKHDIPGYAAIKRLDHRGIPGITRFNLMKGVRRD